MSVTFTYYYVLNSAGTVVSVASSTTPIVVPDHLNIGDEGLITGGPNGETTFLAPYAGYAANGDVFLRNESSDRTFLISNTAYPNGATLSDPYSARTVAPYAVCFLTGTMIATPDGERAVETLVIGDLVLTADGETRPVRWMARQTVRRLFADPLRTYPVRIRAGALGDGAPHRDLQVSPDHALLVGGVLVQAGALVNGVSIVQASAIDETIVYHHIELADHALVLAEGVPAETFVDKVTRRRFDNYAEYLALYGEDEGETVPELDIPRVMAARQLPPHLRALIAARQAA